MNLSSNLKNIKLFGFLLTILGSSFSNSVCGIGLGIYTGALLLEFALLRGTTAHKPMPFLNLLFLFAASLLVSTLISDYLWISVEGYGKYVQGFLLLYAGLDVLETDRERKAVLYTFLFAYALVFLSGTVQHFFGRDFLRGRETTAYQEGIRRLTGPFKHCNDFGTFLVPGFGILVAAWAEAKFHKNRLLALFSIFLFVGLTVVILLTISRSAIFSALAALLVMSLFCAFRRQAFFGVAVIFLLLWFVPSPLRDRLHEIPSFQSGDTSERMILLKTALRMIRENPFFGLGVNTYSDYFPKFKPSDYPSLMYSHNTFLQMASEIGWIGLGLYLLLINAIVFSAAKALWSAPENTARWLGIALIAGAVGILINGLFDSVLQATQLRTLFWILLGCALGIARNGFLSEKSSLHEK